MKIFYESEIKEARELLRTFNRTPLSEILILTDDGKRITVNKNIIERLRFIGLNNMEFFDEIIGNE